MSNITATSRIPKIGEPLGATEEERTTRVTAEEAAAMPSQTDWARVHAMTQEEIDAQAEADMAEEGLVVDWDSVTFNRPPAKAVLHMRLDADLLAFFKAGGPGYQTRINAVLRAYKDAHEGRSAKKAG